MVGPAAKREAVAHLKAVIGLSERRACQIISADRKMVRYRSRRPSEGTPPVSAVLMRPVEGCKS